MDKATLRILVNEDIHFLDESVYENLENLLKVTLETNKLFNLTAIKDEEKFRELMIYDSLLPLKYIDFTDKTVLDVGTGAGFPGLVLALSSKGRYTLLDSTQKKINHINNYIKENNIENAIGVYARAEEYAQNNREKFDYVIARAVAELNILSELCLPFVKVGGSFIALKGDNALEEIARAEKAIEKLGGKIIRKEFDELPESKEKRYLIEIKKVKETPKKYPRSYSEIKSKPIK